MYKQTHTVFLNNVLIEYIVQTTHLFTGCVCLELSLLQCIICVTPYWVSLLLCKRTVFVTCNTITCMFNVMCTVSFCLCLCVYYHSVHILFIIFVSRVLQVVVLRQRCHILLRKQLKNLNTGGSSYPLLVCLLLV